ncbi:MAG: hypothetical protein ACI93T_004177 [Porticoccaceae bacterium]|jgi:hypothetical protein
MSDRRSRLTFGIHAGSASSISASGAGVSFVKKKKVSPGPQLFRKGLPNGNAQEGPVIVKRCPGQQTRPDFVRRFKVEQAAPGLSEQATETSNLAAGR